MRLLAEKTLSILAACRLWTVVSHLALRGDDALPKCDALSFSGTEAPTWSRPTTPMRAAIQRMTRSKHRRLPRRALNTAETTIFVVSRQLQAAQALATVSESICTSSLVCGVLGNTLNFLSVSYVHRSLVYVSGAGTDAVHRFAHGALDDNLECKPGRHSNTGEGEVNASNRFHTGVDNTLCSTGILVDIVGVADSHASTPQGLARNRRLARGEDGRDIVSRRLCGTQARQVQACSSRSRVPQEVPSKTSPAKSPRASRPWRYVYDEMERGHPLLIVQPAVEGVYSMYSLHALAGGMLIRRQHLSSLGMFVPGVETVRR